MLKNIKVQDNVKCPHLIPRKHNLYKICMVAGSEDYYFLIGWFVKVDLQVNDFIVIWHLFIMRIMEVHNANQDRLGVLS